MEKQYEVYCLKDRLFYDVLDGQESPAFTIVDDPLPEGWQRISAANGSSTFPR